MNPIRYVLIAITLIYTQAGIAEVNKFDLWGKENLAWEEENRPKANLASDISLYMLISSAIIVPSLQRGLKHGAVAVGTLGVNAGLNQLVKHQVGRERPDGSDRLSFYSGHTSNAFFASGAICIQSKKLCPIAIGLAGITGYLRIAANRHWTTDVLFAGGLSFYLGKVMPTLVIKW